MDPWTPSDREEFVSLAVNSTESKGNKGPYHYNVYPHAIVNEQDDHRKTLLTEALAKVIFSGKPAYRKISLKFYETLMQKLSTHFATGPFMNSDICVLIKGGNAYTYIVDPEDLDKFPYSDLDIVISVNPALDDEVFEYISYNIHIIVLQTISQYKRMLDHLLFINKEIENPILTSQEVADFKKDFNEAVRDIPCGENEEYFSPFESDEIRNTSSRYSFMLAHSKVQDNKIVKIDLPHFDKCERIPMRKTPLFCSYNETISFKRDNADLDGHFDLYRIRFNCLFTEMDKNQKLTADFIDVVIGAKDDAELIDFWNKGKYMCVLDKKVGIWLSIPTLETCIEDLNKMLTIYSCPEGKRSKREFKYNLLKQISQRNA
jgi:hypothetical protein